MSNFIRKLPPAPTFIQRGLRGYQFPLQLKSAEIYFVDVSQGHDNFVCSDSVTQVYYVIEGTGEFVINEVRYAVTAHDLIEIPPNHTFAYSGELKLLLVMSPPFAAGEVRVVRANPEVR